MYESILNKEGDIEFTFFYNKKTGIIVEAFYDYSMTHEYVVINPYYITEETKPLIDNFISVNQFYEQYELIRFNIDTSIHKSLFEQIIKFQREYKTQERK